MPGEQLTVASLNTRGIPVTGSRLASRYEAIGAAFEAGPADVVCFQEVFTYWHLRLLARRMVSFARVSYRPSPAGPAGGLVTFSRRPVSGRPVYRGFGVPPQAPGIPRLIRLRASGKGALVTRLARPSLRVVNTHPVANWDGDWSESNRFYPLHRAQLDALTRVVGSVAPPAVVCGDFNIDRGSSLFAGFVVATGLADAFGGSCPPTFRAEFLPPGEVPHCIDFILTTDGIRPAAATVLFTGKQPLPGAQGYVSDHLGLSASLVVLPVTMGEVRYIIIGAGAVGGTIGARLFDSGHEVVLVARGRHLDALRSGGLALTTPDGESTLRIPAIGAAAEVDLRPDDVLLVTVKTQDAAAVLADWAWRPVRGGTVAASSLPVVCAQNGVASEGLALRRFRQVYGMCVWLPATHLEPGTVQAQGAPLAGMLHLGRYPSGSDATAAQIAGDLERSRFLAPVTADVMRWKYGKLLVNLGNAIDAVCGVDAGREAAELRRRATAEGAAVLGAAGIGYVTEAESTAARGDQVQIRRVNGSSRGGSSSWQSLTRGTGSIEADFLNGEIVLLGREHGVPTPVNEVLQRLANQAAQERRAPGTVTPGEIAALIPA